MNISVIRVGGYDWYCLKQMGDDYFLLSVGIPFRGYYNSQCAPFVETKLAAFLRTVFLPRLGEAGADTDKLSNVGILTLLQYNTYVKNSIPAAPYPFLLQTPDPDNNGVYAVDTSGNIITVGFTESCGIRPCMFIDREYADSLTGACRDQAEERITGDMCKGNDCYTLDTTRDDPEITRSDVKKAGKTCVFEENVHPDRKYGDCKGDERYGSGHDAASGHGADTGGINEACEDSMMTESDPGTGSVSDGADASSFGKDTVVSDRQTADNDMIRERHRKLQDRWSWQKSQG